MDVGEVTRLVMIWNAQMLF